MKVIVNADDLGYSTGVNRAIFSLMDRGKITSATLMANGGAFEDAVNQIKSFSTNSFGVHLNLTEFPALTRPNIFYDTKLIDTDGNFTNNRNILYNILSSSTLQNAILNEWKQQVTKVLDHGVIVSHLDSHHQTHTIPWLFPTFKKLQKEFEIRKARTTKNWFYGKEFTPSYKGILVRGAWNFGLKHIYKTKTTDYYTKFIWFKWFLLNNICNGKYTSQSTVELNCHPGQPYAIEEYKQLCSNWTNQLPTKIDLISYHQL